MGNELAGPINSHWQQLGNEKKTNRPEAITAISIVITRAVGNSGSLFLVWKFSPGGYILHVIIDCHWYFCFPQALVEHWFWTSSVMKIGISNHNNVALSNST